MKHVEIGRKDYQVSCVVPFAERSVPVGAYTFVLNYFTTLLSCRKPIVIQMTPVHGNESVFYPLNAMDQLPSGYLPLSIS